jgi:5-methylcytosine-specific restriction endonuclease McrBC regulatory subunit McrC
MITLSYELQFGVENEEDANDSSSSSLDMTHRPEDEENTKKKNYIIRIITEANMKEIKRKCE